MKIISWNIRYQNPTDDARGCGWAVRREPLCAILREQAPDILAVQEACAPQVDDLRAALPAYKMAGAGREDGKRQGEFCAIYFRDDLYDLRAQSTRWLSPTPDEPSRGWGADCIRIVTRTRLLERASGREFEVWNAHLDNVSPRARLQSAKLLRDGLLESDAPAILCGDFNSTPDDQPLTTLTENQNLRDSRIWARYERSGPHATFCGFADFTQRIEAPISGEKARIDYILVTRDWLTERYAVLPTDENPFPVSDHRPVIVELKHP